MSKQLDTIDDGLKAWLEEQHVFFVATAPLSGMGHVNCSPKGGDCFRVLGPLEVAYLDLTGSGAETIAHLRENGRIVLMFCAFTGKPNIVRLHGVGDVVALGEEGYADLAAHFPPNIGARAVIRVKVSRVSSSCGFAVPLLDFREDRQTLDKFAETKGAEFMADYRAEHNAQSIDGLPALSTP